jgi:membrane protease YdiL (CAAX protease family)
MKRGINDRICFYFLLAYVFTWLFWIPRAFASQGYFQLPVDPVVFHIMGAFGPAVAAILLTWSDDGKSGLRRLFASYGHLKIHWTWYAFVLLTRPLIWSVALLGYFILGRQKLLPQDPDLVFFFLYLVSQLLVVGVGEELGWSGYALPRLHVRHGFVKANLILGILWGLWHLPFFFTLGDTQYGSSIALFVIKLTAFRFLFSFAYLRTGSLVMPGLFHVSFNVLSEQIPLSPNDPLAIGMSVVFAVVWLLIEKRRDGVDSHPSILESGVPIVSS